MSERPENDPRPPRLLAVMVDWLPAWMLPAYGATWVSAPALDALAAAGVVFDRVLAPSVAGDETLEAIVPFASDPAVAGQVARTEDLDAAADLVRRGRHRVVVCHVRRLGRAWQAPAEMRERYRDPEDPPAMEGAEIPKFATGEDTDPDRLTVVRQAFAAEVTSLDEEFGRLLGAVSESSESWHVCVAGTGGMPLGLHGQVGMPGPEDDCIPPYGERIHLPVILREAGGRMAGQRFPGLLAAADIGATLSEWATGRGAAAGVARLFEDWTARPREQVFIRGRGAAALAMSAWHLVAEWPGGREAGVKASLHAKPDDWFEVADVADRCPTEVEALLRDCLAEADLSADFPG